MDVTHLPQDIFSQGTPQQEKIIFHPYKAPMGSFRGRCILHCNAISLVIAGAKTMHFSERTVSVKSDEIHFLSAGNCMVTMNLDKQQVMESILIFFDNTALADFHLRYKVSTGDGNRTEPFLRFKKDQFIHHYITSLQLLLQSGTAMSGEMRRLKFEELMLYLLERYPTQLAAFPLSKSRDLEDLEIRRAVEANVLTGISLEELAFICNCSLSTFKRRFMAIYGVAPRAWFLQKRMEMAKEMIVQGGERPSEIYHKFGYETHSSFSQSFKQYFGVSPKDMITK